MRGPPRSTRTDTPFPYTPLFRSRVFQLKGQDTPAATRFAIDPHRPHAIYTPEEIAIRVVYNGDAEVSVETGAGRVLERRPSPRAVFDGMAREYPWDLLHLAYFCG